jgi:hypothetical protein
MLRMDTCIQQRTMVDMPLGMVLLIIPNRKVQWLKSRWVLDRGFGTDSYPSFADLVADTTPIMPVFIR